FGELVVAEFDAALKIIDGGEPSCRHPERSEGPVWAGGARNAIARATRASRSLAHARDDGTLRRLDRLPRHLPQPLHEPQSQPHRAVLPAAIPAGVIDVDRKRVHAV